MWSKPSRNLFLILLLFMFVGILLFVEAPVYAYSKVTPTPIVTPVVPITVVPSDSQVDILEEKIRGLEKNIQTQSEAYSTTVTRMEANMNLLLAVIAVASLLVAFLGFGVVKIWIRQLVEERIQKALAQEVSKLAEEEIKRIRGEWEPKFASLYDEYRRTITRK